MDVAFQHDWFPLYAVGCTLLVFSVCIIIDKLRIALVFGPLRGRIDDLTDWAEERIRMPDLEQISDDAGGP